MPTSTFRLKNYSKGFAIGAARAALWQGVYHQLKGELEKAQASWATSTQVAQEMKMPYDVELVPEIKQRFSG